MYLATNVFAIVNDLTQLISEPTRIPDRSRDMVNTLDLILTSNTNIYSKPTVNSLLVTLITVSSPCSMTPLSPIRIRLFQIKRYFTSAKLTGTLFAPFTPHIPGTLASLMILPLLPLLLQMEFYLVWIFSFHLPLNLARKIL